MGRVKFDPAGSRKEGGASIPLDRSDDCEFDLAIGLITLRSVCRDPNSCLFVSSIGSDCVLSHLSLPLPLLCLETSSRHLEGRQA